MREGERIVIWNKFACMQLHTVLDSELIILVFAFLSYFTGDVQGLGHPDPTWEIAYNHFHIRLGFTNLTHTAAIIKVRFPHL